MKKHGLFLIGLLIGLVACQSNEQPEVTPEPDPIETPTEEPKNELPPLITRADINLTDAEKQVVGHNNAFAFKLLQAVYKNEEAQGNIFLSPLSASLALSMLNNGAAGNTQKEIQDALGYGGISREELNAYAQKMIKAMTELDTRGVFESANSIWIEKGFPVLDGFKTVNRQYYDAEVRNEDFSNPATVGVINNWVKEKTGGKIEDLLSEISPEMKLFLINALYFKGYWSMPFSEDETKNLPFSNLDGTSQAMPTMQMLTSGSRYLKRDNCELLELPFGNEAFSLVVLLPDKGVSLPMIMGQLNAGWWSEYLTSVPKPNTEIYLRLPRFKVEYERGLNDELKALGMVSMYDDKADFSLINPDAGLFVTEVKQKAFAEINELGMEAAAATMVGMATTAIPETPPTRIDFHVDRPFLLFLKEKSTGSIFFTGVIKNLK